MRAYKVNAFCDEIMPVDQPDLTPKGTEVVIEVSRCGVCHTDLHLQDGYYDLGGGKKLELKDRGVHPPLTMGHEVLGRLIAKGTDAEIADSEIGKTFLVYPWIGCGECATCRGGDENLCTKPSSLGVFRPGGYAEQCMVPHPRYLVDVTGIEPTLASTYACSGLTAYSALNKVQMDRGDDLLLLMGLGGVGFSGLTIARALGFQNIAVADIDPAKRDLALRSGARLVLDPRDEQASATLFERHPRGAAGVVDFVAGQSTAEFSLGVLGKGGIYVAVGLFGGNISLPLPPLVLRALTLRGSYTGSLGELKELIDLVKSGKVPPIPVEAVAFDQVNDALSRLRAGHVHGRLVLSR